MIDRNIANLHPLMRDPICRLIALCDTAKFHMSDGGVYVFRFFEGYRSPERQAALMADAAVTKAGAWRSAHQYGLAADFAAYRIDGPRLKSGARWNWGGEAPWENLKGRARSVGLSIPISWDRGHVQHPVWTEEIRRVIR